MKEHYNPNGGNISKDSLKYFVLSFTILFVLSYSILFFVEKQIRDVQFNELKVNEMQLITLESNLLSKEFGMILSDLHYLHYSQEKSIPDESNHIEIASDWKIFSTQRNIYDQIRYIDNEGYEKIRINKAINGSYIIPTNELQNKKDRYYFYETASLETGDVYVSQLDLNVENKNIELPYKPVLRFSTALRNEDKSLNGVLVINYLANKLLSDFRNLANSSNGELFLLNSNGYWLSSNDPEQEWGFIIPERSEQNFSNFYPDEWSKIIKGDGQVLTENGLFTFLSVPLKHNLLDNNPSIVDPNVILGSGDWYIVSMVLRDGETKSFFIDKYQDLLIQVFVKNLLFFTLVSIISLIIAFLVYLNRATYSRIKYYSEFDSLTKVYNRRAGLNKINNLIPDDDRRSHKMSLCFIDVNGLKSVNDNLGHEAGDELIVSIVDIIKSVIRDDDFIVRLGGDEFLIVFNNIEETEAELVWDRIVTVYTNVNNTEDRPYNISVSHGIVSENHYSETQVDKLIKEADEKMYTEKKILKQNLHVIKED